MWRRQKFHFGRVPSICRRIVAIVGVGWITCNTQAQNAAGIPRPDHVVIVMEENRGLVGIVGANDAPYINSLAARGALLTEYYAVAHPSQPNYLALFSGSTQGVNDDSCPHHFATPNLAKSLLDAGLTFAGYAESLPAPGSATCEAGPYARKHVPWINFENVPARLNLPFSQFPSDFRDLPTLSFVIPNEDNDMHSGSTQRGDSWLRNHLDPYVQWAQTNNSLLIVSFDEGGPLNQVTTILVGPMVKPGTYCARVTHYHLLRTLEDMFGLTYAGRSASVPPIANVWRTGHLPPQGELTSPVPGTTLAAGTNVILAAETVPGAAAITKVEFFSGATRLGEVLTAPYTMIWSNVPSGASCLSTKVTDAQGNVNTSASVPINVAGETGSRFAAAKGPYSGLFAGDSDAGVTNSGLLTLNVTSRGSFTGRLFTGGTRYPLRGHFDDSGQAQLHIDRIHQTPLVIELGLDLAGGTNRVSGSVSDGVWNARLEGERVTRKNAAAGTYTLLISPVDASGLPGGNGSGFVNVNASGQVRLSANLGDGTRVIRTGTLTGLSRFPFYAPLYNGRGAILGWINFHSDIGALDGRLLWTKSSSPGDISYPEGFTAYAFVSGSRRN